jgi:hypothetical protein
MGRKPSATSATNGTGSSTIFRQMDGEAVQPARFVFHISNHQELTQPVQLMEDIFGWVLAKRFSWARGGQREINCEYCHIIKALNLILSDVVYEFRVP